MEKYSALLEQVQGGLDAYLMIGVAQTTSDTITSTFGLYDKDGEVVEGDVLDLLTFVWLTYQRVAEGMDLPIEDIHDMVGQVMNKVPKE